MPVPAEADITGLLKLAASGDADAEKSLFELLYDDLKRQAQSLMRRQARGHTLQATGLLHEAWLRVARRPGVGWQNRGHFFAVAARAMRSVLVDHARGKNRRRYRPRATRSSRPPGRTWYARASRSTPSSRAWRAVRKPAWPSASIPTPSQSTWSRIRRTIPGITVTKSPGTPLANA